MMRIECGTLLTHEVKLWLTRSHSTVRILQRYLFVKFEVQKHSEISLTLTSKGLRYVQPYYFQYNLRPQNRWIGKRIYEIFCEEFYAYDKFNHYKNAINKGLITVNNKSISLDYVYQRQDKICSMTHRHEPPISCNDDDIEIIDSELGHNRYNLIVVNKPCSVPVHPVGRYRYNSLKWILNDVLNKGNNDIHNEKECIHVHNAHRLDTVCSGLTIFTTLKTPKKYVAKIHKRFANNELDKMYVAKVLGDFQPNKITVNAPIGISSDREKLENGNDNEDDAAYIKYGVDMINGKESVTHFVKKSFDGEFSIIQCYPKTGRSHQIRVHLQYLNYPIVNDIKYGGISIKGSEYQIETYVDDEESSLKNMITDHWDENCVECQMILKQIKGEIKDPFDKTKQICLHSLYYKCDKDDWEYKTQMPEWA